MKRTKTQIFLLHFAGGNKYSYQSILPSFKPFDTVVLELPGRGMRIKEGLIRSQNDAVDDLYRQIMQFISPGDEFLIFGHSMGAILGLRLCDKLESNGVFPKGLMVTGNAGPGIQKENLKYDLPKEAFKLELKKLGGIPDEVLENDELFDFFELVLRADFEIIELGENESTSPIKTPIYAVMGDQETDVLEINNWEKFTTGGFESEIWSGDHFFIFKHGDRLVRILVDYFL